MPGIGDSSDVVAREEAWFQSDQSGAINGYGQAQPLPPLTTDLGGPFDIVQGYGRKISTRQRGLYIWRANIVERRYGVQMKTLTYDMRCNIVWPLANTSGNGYEADQADLDAAIEAVLQRIRGPKADGTHGGRFTAAGEEKNELVRDEVKVELTNPMISIERGYQEVAVRYPCLDSSQS